MSKIPKDMVVGTVHESNNCGTFKVLGYANAHNVTVEFVATKYTTNKSAANIRRGQVKDLHHPSVEGIGYLGGSTYSKLKDRKAYQTWHSMLSRCYSGRYASYTECNVCVQWHNFQTFAEWFYTNYIEDYHLDKDIVGDSIEYSPTKCIFVTSEDNSKQAAKTLGVSWLLVDTSTGIEILVDNQREFCREESLSRSGIGSLCRGVFKTSQGYTLKEVIKEYTNN